jgi:hypothetical protein
MVLQAINIHLRIMCVALSAALDVADRAKCFDAFIFPRLPATRSDGLEAAEDDK